MTTDAEGSVRWSGGVEMVYDRLRLAILDGQLAADTWISQGELCERFDVTRTPLREALRMLQSDGLVEAEPNRRVRISPLSVRELEELYSSRIVLEALGVRASVPQFSTQDLDELSHALNAMDAAAPDNAMEDWERAHHRYHQLLQRYAGPRFGKLTSDLADHTERYRRIYLQERRVWPHATAEHHGVFDACLARDPALAAQLLATHLARTALTVAASAEPLHDPYLIRAALQQVDGSAGT